jgi:hypothetical protein
MKTATQIYPSTITLNAAQQTAAQMPVNHMIFLPSRDEVERRLCKVNALIAFYHEVESLCYLMVGIAGIGLVLYSAGVFLHAID